ncbi:hypothetical protein ZOSMA_2G02730 [Zostera marina]|uniref:Uncharacterized protein n=1 Tax=Zostera marina TaxID=29655 RepID=A0A0K9PDF2_ZOSMR|nr:hypothetical protein ZOSMA_2G02730 [Zostera marina]
MDDAMGVELSDYHDGLKKWIEVGNSEKFRPGMLLSMGLRCNCNCMGTGSPSKGQP